jgi:acetoin utilization deacetylase AcuC-like enzyme
MDLPVVNHKDYFAKIGDDHKFPIKKFGELANFLIDKKIVKKFYEPYPCSDETLKRAHSASYIKNIKDKTLDQNVIKKIGFPLVDSVIQRSLVATGGTVLASKLAINYGLACNTAGGSHHANFEGGAGYCVFNDVAVASQYLLSRGLAGRILIVDLDVHQGNGNSDIFKDNRNVFTFSMHSKSNYPAKKSISDLDVELDDKMEDKQYLNILNFYLNQLNQENFDYVFYIAGVDIHFNDRLGKLKISDEGIRERDEMVTENFFSKGIPLCGVLGGGYNKDFNKLVELHSFLHQSCAKLL